MAEEIPGSDFVARNPASSSGYGRARKVTPGALLTPEALEIIRGPVTAIGYGWSFMMEFVQREHVDKLQEDFNALSGSTISAGTLFGVWDHIEAKDIRQTEVDWLRKLVKFGKHVQNSMLGFPLEYKPQKGDLFPKMSDEKLRLFSKLNSDLGTINLYTPDTSVGTHTV